MGDHTVTGDITGSQRRAFMRRLLDDLRALEFILSNDLIETGVRRIGAEQELFLVDANWRPAPLAMELLSDLNHPQITTELGLFNLEINLDPCTFDSTCLRRIEAQLEELLALVRSAAEKRDAAVVLTGILPTMRKSDLGESNMTPLPRYAALNRAMSAMRGGAYEFHIKGLDELMLKHDSVMLEACNASFQVHFQVGAREFANLYNIAQLVAGPVLAAAANSPLLFGRQLWRETRIALFQQAIDTRSSLHYLRERSPRVTFGDHWVQDSVLELFQEDISRFRALVCADLTGDPLDDLRNDRMPDLKALRLHNGTVYRWNRACYGMTDGKPHLRIENRVLPAGPSVPDQVANAAFWFGLISAIASKYDDVSKVMQFDDAKMNFHSAAREGLGAQFGWLNGETLPAANLICDRLVPLARDGLAQSGIDSADADRYLTIIDRRVGRSRTGALWMLHSLAGMRGQGTVGEQMNALTGAMVARQADGTPVHEWEPAAIGESGGWKQNFVKVEQYMTTDLFTVHEDESLDLVACMMEWERIRHIPVEGPDHSLVGLVSYRSLLRLLARGEYHRDGKQVSVSAVMKRDPVSVSPDASTLEAIALMKRHKVGCLPVVKDNKLVGIITERDFMNVAAEMLEEQLRP